MRLAANSVTGVPIRREPPSGRPLAAEPDQILRLAEQLRESGFDNFSDRERRVSVVRSFGSCRGVD
jgi:hypothetical protein